LNKIKIKDRSGVLLHPADWTAGVDYDEAEAPQNDDDDDVPDLDLQKKSKKEAKKKENKQISCKFHVNFMSMSCI
jgi:hypothetical protein